MKLLLKTAFKNSNIGTLIALTITSMIFLTFASQLEIFALGVITKKGPGFFELFAPLQDGQLVPGDSVSEKELLNRWQELDPKGKGYVTKDEVVAFTTEKKGSDFITKAISLFDSVIPITDSFKGMALFLIMVAFAKASALFFNRYTTKLIAITVSKDLRKNFFEHIQSLPMSFYNQHNIGSLSTRAVNDAYVISESINSCLINYIQTPFTVVTTLTLCFLTSWRLSLIMFLGFPLIVFPIFFIAKRIKRISRQILQNQEHFLSVLVDFISGIQTIKVFAMEDFSLKKFNEQNENLARLEEKSARYDVSSRPIVHTIGMSFLATALIYGLYVQQMTISEVVFFCGLLYVFYEPIKKFAEENNHIQRGLAAAERMMEVLEVKPHIEDSIDAAELEGFEEKIEFDDVWFKYADEWVLKGMSFSVKKGQTVAIVGPTGAGKSTIIQLLPRLYDVSKGEIRIDGIPITNFTQRSLREQLAIVPQRPFLFVDSIANNVSFGKKFTLEDVKNAVSLAHAEEFVTRLPNGYETVLAEAGKDLSGGQQQRLTIARALFKKAPILVMDEATSSLDLVSENHIKTAIHGLRGKITQIIIAHRLSTIEDADKIIYVDGGVKIAEGTKDQLLESCHGFKLMWEMMHKNTKTEAQSKFGVGDLSHS